MAVSFAKNATTIYLQNPVLQNVLRTHVAQVIGRSQGGDRYTYDQGVSWQELELQFDNLRDSEKADLQSFFESTTDGMRLSFTYADHHGNSWTAYFNDAQLEFTEVGDEVNARTTFASDGTDYPTTTRKNPVWSIRLTLEATAA